MTGPRLRIYPVGVSARTYYVFVSRCMSVCLFIHPSVCVCICLCRSEPVAVFIAWLTAFPPLLFTTIVFRCLSSGLSKRTLLEDGNDASRGSSRCSELHHIHTVEQNTVTFGTAIIITTTMCR